MQLTRSYYPIQVANKNIPCTEPITSRNLSHVFFLLFPAQSNKNVHKFSLGLFPTIHFVTSCFNFKHFSLREPTSSPFAARISSILQHLAFKLFTQSKPVQRCRPLPSTTTQREGQTFYLQSSSFVSGCMTQPTAASVHTCWVTSPLIDIACIFYRTHSASIYIPLCYSQK